MKNQRSAGAIEERIAGKSYRIAGITGKEGYRLTKIFVGNDSDNWVKELFPTAEVVDNVESIIHDSTIDLVIMPGSEPANMNMVAEVLQSGKNLRIV